MSLLLSMNIFLKMNAMQQLLKTSQSKYYLQHLTKDFRHTTVFNEFCGLFEQKIEKIIVDSSVTVQEFYDALKRQIETDPESSFYVEILLAATDYTSFIDMMKHYKRDHHKLK